MIVLWAAVVCLVLAGGSGSPVYDLSPPQHPLEPTQHAHKKVHPYQFDYAVKDQYRALDFGRSESQDDDGKVTGQYHVLLPDGRTQVVTYTADHYSGFQADVHYQGEAQESSGYRQPEQTSPQAQTAPQAENPTRAESEQPAALTTSSTSQPKSATAEPKPATAQPKPATAQPTYPAPQAEYPAPRPKYPAPQPRYPAYGPPRFPAGPAGGYHIPPPPGYGRRPAPRPHYGAPARPRHAYIPPPPARGPVYFASRPTEAPLATAAVVAELTTAAPSAGPAGTTPGLADDRPLPLVAVDPVPELADIQLQEPLAEEKPQEEVAAEEEPQDVVVAGEERQEDAAADEDGSAEQAAAVEGKSSLETAAAEPQQEQEIRQEAEVETVPVTTSESAPLSVTLSERLKQTGLAEQRPQLAEQKAGAEQEAKVEQELAAEQEATPEQGAALEQVEAEAQQVLAEGEAVAVGRGAGDGATAAGILSAEEPAANVPSEDEAADIDGTEFGLKL